MIDDTFNSHILIKKMQPLTRVIPLYLNTIRVLSEY